MCILSRITKSTLSVMLPISINVEQFSTFRVRFEYDGINLFFQLVIMQEVVPMLKYSRYEFRTFIICFIVRNKVNNKSECFCDKLSEI